MPAELQSGGASAVAGAAVAGYGLLGQLLGANMNSTTDQAVPMAASKYIVRRIVATNASVSLTTAVGGVYSATSKGGVAIVAAAQVYSALTTGILALDLTVAAAGLGTTFSVASPFLSLTIAQGSAATADLYVWGERIS